MQTAERAGSALSVSAAWHLELTKPLYPGLRPDFISQPWRKVDFSPRLQDKVWAEAWVRG